MSKPVLVCVGDSIAAGIGARGASYATLLAGMREMVPLDLTASAKQLPESFQQIHEIVDAAPTLIIVAHGVTELMPRPLPRHLSRLPPRYRRDGWLDPRPYFSSWPLRRRAQALESALRWRLKVALLRKGRTSHLTVEAFALLLDEFVLRLVNETSAAIVLVGPPHLDDKMFPHANDHLRALRRVQARTASTEVARVLYVDITEVLQPWDDYLEDRFHPNEKGHQRIAALIDKSLK